MPLKTSVSVFSKQAQPGVRRRNVRERPSFRTVRRRPRTSANFTPPFPPVLSCLPYLAYLTYLTVASRTSQIAQIGKRQLELSNLQKVLYPDDHIIKAELIQYYVNIAPTILAHIKGRPLSLVRYPD